MTDKTLDILAAHYAKRSELLSDKLKERKKLAYLIFVAACLLLLKAYNPAQFTRLTTGALASWAKMGDTAHPFEPPQWFLGSVIWILLAFLMVDTFGISLIIENQAHYLRELEKRLCEGLNCGFPTAHQKYVMGTKYFAAANRFYSLMMPVVILMVLCYGIVRELQNAVQYPEWWVAIFAGINVVCFAAILFFTGKYIQTMRAGAETQGRAA